MTSSCSRLPVPGVQAEKDAAIAERRAHAVNDFLAAEIQKRPARYGGFAHLAMHNPSRAADELERCIRDLGFQGALINGQTNGEYLDLDKYSIFWSALPNSKRRSIFIRATRSITPQRFPATPSYGARCAVGPSETATHALRLLFGGVFERYPKARLILGHGGETLPFSLWRFDSRWLVCNRGGRTLSNPPSFYVRRNIAVTTSGMCSDQSLRCCLDAMGAENVMFSIDYPFEKTDLATRFIETAILTEAERTQVASANATRILHLHRRHATGDSALNR